MKPPLSKIGPGYSNRNEIRQWVGMSASTICAATLVTLGVIKSWESSHTGELVGMFGTGKRGTRERVHAVTKLADIYAALMWIACGGRWPEALDDEPLQAAVRRMRHGRTPDADESFPLGPRTE